MAHNVAPSRNPNTEGEIGRLTIAAAAQSSPSGAVREMRVSRVRGGLRFKTEGALAGVDVHGEDLFALRELIEELPESAFVRPADPVEESYCLQDGSGGGATWWAYNGTHWWCIGNADGESRDNLHNGASSYPGLDEGAASIFEDFGTYVDLRPFWSDGDIFELSGTTDTLAITYQRFGSAWYRTVMQRHGGPATALDSTTDAQAKARVTNDDDSYRVVRRANAEA